MKPLIGISSYFVNAWEMDNNRPRGLKGQDMQMSTMDYSRAVQMAGGTPFMIAPINDENYLAAIIDSLDGLLLSGGGDVYPGSYNKPYQQGLGYLEPLRDQIELKLVEFALKKNIPIFGICRGMQILNVYFGGTLIQDINKYFNTDIQHVGLQGMKWNIVHQVNLVTDEYLHTLYKKNKLNVNSLHHQCIENLAENLKAIAISDDGLIEAVIHREHVNVWAVQWHPEMMCENIEEQLLLFKNFINMC